MSRMVFPFMVLCFCLSSLHPARAEPDQAAGEDPPAAEATVAPDTAPDAVETTTPPDAVETTTPPDAVATTTAPGAVATTAVPGAVAKTTPPSDDANDFSAKSKVTAVTVFGTKARVTREMIVDVPAGAHKAAFKNLPLGLEPDTLRAGGSADVKVQLGGVVAKIATTSAPPPPDHRAELRARLRELRDQQSYIDAEKLSLESERKFLTDVTNTVSSDGGRDDPGHVELKPDQWLPAAHSVRDGLGDLLKQEVQLNIKTNVINSEMAQANAALTPIPALQVSSYEVEIPFETAAATKLTLRLTYQLPGATWAPLYDARLDSAGKSSLELDQYGEVSQKTGEDWTGAALTLSTAQPERGASLPALATQWVDASEINGGGLARIQATTLLMDNSDTFEGGGAQTGSATSFKDMSSNIATASSGFNSIIPTLPSSPPPQQDAHVTTAEVRTGGFIAEYRIPGPSTVPGDGSATRLMIGAFETDSRLQVHIKPQQSPDAFLVARCTLKGESAILPGKVNLFRDTAFIGQSTLPALRPGEETDFYFGIDDEVSVKHSLTEDRKSETGVLSHDNVTERGYVTQVQNLHSRAMDFVVSETIPVSRTDRVAIERLPEPATTEGFTADAEDVKGRVDWNFKLEKQQKKDIKLGWKVKWPTNYALSGI